MKLILVRYGTHENGHLNEQGKKNMIDAVKLLKPFVVNKKACLISANIPRAIESAEIISEKLENLSIKPFNEFYAAEEEGIKVDIDKARNILNSLINDFEVVIAVISREYIEKLSDKNLERGEISVLEYK